MKMILHKGCAEKAVWRMHRYFFLTFIYWLALLLCPMMVSAADGLTWIVPTSVQVGMTFDVIAYYKDKSNKADVTFDSAASSASIGGAYSQGVRHFMAAEAGTAVFSATYRCGAGTFTGTKSVTITESRTLGYIRISTSSSSVSPGDTVRCNMTAYSTYGEYLSRAKGTWSISSTSGDKISSSGVVTVAPTQVSRKITVKCTCTYYGVTRSYTETINVTRLPVALENIRLESIDSVCSPGTQIQISVVAKLIDGSFTTEGVGSWHVLSEGFGDSVSSDGIVTIANTNISRVVRVSCDYSYGGVTKSAEIEFQVQSRCDTPIITPANGTIFESSQQIAMSCSSEGSVIHYTVDGSDPTIDSPIYKRFRINSKTIIKAAAFNSDGRQSDIVVAEYALGRCEDPIIAPTYGLKFGTAYGTTTQKIKIVNEGAEGELHYTLDGTEPTIESPVYEECFEINDTTTVKARAFSDVWFDSQVVTVTLTREWERVSAPVINSAESFGGSKTKVSLCCSTLGARIYYTIDGSEPSINSLLYSDPFEISGTTSVKAFATREEYIDSAIISKTISRVWWIGDSLGLPDHEFTTDGNAGWVDDGGKAMKSGKIGHNQESILQTTFVGKGLLRFELKTSCEEDDPEYVEYDHAEFMIDGELVIKQDGVHDWFEFAYELGEGVHPVVWKYVKDGLDDAPYPGEDCIWLKNIIWTPVVPGVEGDSNAVVEDDAASGFVIKPSKSISAVEVMIPQGVDAAKVTVEVSPKVATVKPNGAKVKIVVGENDITGFLVIPESEGVLNIAAATVKEEIVKETLDPTKEAVLELNAANPQLITAPTRKGLTYTLYEGHRLESLSKGDSKLGDGNPWMPTIRVSGGDAAFYSIDVRK